MEEKSEKGQMLDLRSDKRTVITKGDEDEYLELDGK